jgi:hypothetical protein
MKNKDERPLFEGMDELERTYAPEELPPDDPERVRVRLDEGEEAADRSKLDDVPAAALVANIGIAPNAPAASLAPKPNIGHEEHDGAPGTPNPEARDPLDN